MDPAELALSDTEVAFKWICNCVNATPMWYDMSCKSWDLVSDHFFAVAKQRVFPW